MSTAPVFPALFFVLFAFGAAAQCPPGQSVVRLEINTDSYYYEESWKVTSADGSVTYGSGTVPDSATHNYEYCVPVNQCVTFTLFDSANDGFFPDGFYRLFVNDTLVYERLNGSFFGPSESVTFNCPPGTSCTSPIYLNTGSGTTPGSVETWYSFTPQDTGTYVITTCGASCPTKIWVYDRCANIFISENQLGAIYYADSGCPDGAASAQLHLAGGVEYFIRIRYQVPGCSADPIPYSLNYLGPVVGCTDPTACNFEPLAMVSNGLCIYPGDPNCPNAPDFVVNEQLLLSSLLFTDYTENDVCYVEEGCLRGTGTRHLIEFSTHIKNIGDEDYFIGEPPADINAPSTQFVYDPCHHHWHYLGYADYILYNSSGYRVPVGSKTGFCVLDLECSDGGDQKYTCVNMGISAQCGDIYDRSLPCQWIDITDIPADDYTMVVRVNWDKSPDKLGRVEKRYDNNWAQACFTLSYDGNTPDVVFNTDSCQQFTDCEGVVFGDAQPDCNGVCKGPALIGDWNQDTLRDANDGLLYVVAALQGNGSASTCNDLHEDGEINVFDAALLQECYLHADDPQYWIQRFPCQFPSGFQNPQDLVTLQLGSVDTLAKTIDIDIVNPYNRILAYEFSLSGLAIESIVNLSVEHQTVPLFNPTTGKIIAIANNESSIPKHQSPASFLRVHYSSLTDNEICISEIVSVVSSKYQESNAMIGTPSCVLVNTVGLKEPENAAFAVFVQPNPMRESTTVFFDNKNAEPMSFTLTDLTGRTLRSFDNLRGESVVVERNGLPEGSYLFTLRGSRGSVSGKLLIQ